MARIRENISSDSLFHFVSKIEYLKDIIERGFQARYCHETFPLLDIPLCIPMKCFCDIPLGKIKVHIKNFHGFGIGITKKYAMAKQITPVIYVHDKSATLLGFLNEVQSQGPFLSNKYSILPYFKLYDETRKGKGKSKIVRRYYDEREWRYIPKNPDFVDLRDLKKTEIKDKIEEANKHLPDRFRFTVPLKEISYLFVEQDKDVPTLITLINNLNLIDDSEKDMLISKIITANQMTHDF
jgi:hypothetical protein